MFEVSLFEIDKAIERSEINTHLSERSFEQVVEVWQRNQILRDSVEIEINEFEHEVEAAIDAAELRGHESLVQY